MTKKQAMLELAEAKRVVERMAQMQIQWQFGWIDPKTDVRPTQYCAFVDGHPAMKTGIHATAYDALLELDMIAREMKLNICDRLAPDKT